MNKNITDAFETLTQDEWDNYLSTDLFEGLVININNFRCSDNRASQIVFQKIQSIMQAHNNRVGSIKVSYALAKHYYDKGIPDDEWYKSPGENGCSVQYMPHFSPEHFLIRYWYCFFMEDLYGKVISLWDSLYSFINNYYELNVEEKLHFISKILEKIKTSHPELYNILYDANKNDKFVKFVEYSGKIFSDALSIIAEDDFCVRL